MNQRPILFLVRSEDSDGGYKSGRNSLREIPETRSTSSVRSAGTRPRDSQPEIVPCDLSPSSRANADWPSTRSHAASSASLLMRSINAQNVNSVNARSANGLRHYSGMGRQAEREGSEFWLRLVEAWGEQDLPISQNGVAEKLGMKGNGSTGRWFRGETFPETDTITRIAELGKVTIDWLLTGRLPKHPLNPKDPLGRIHITWGSLDDTYRGFLAQAAEDHAVATEKMQPAKITKTRA